MLKVPFQQPCDDSTPWCKHGLSVAWSFTSLEGYQVGLGVKRRGWHFWANHAWCELSIARSHFDYLNIWKSYCEVLGQVVCISRIFGAAHSKSVGSFLVQHCWWQKKVGFDATTQWSYLDAKEGSLERWACASTRQSWYMDQRECKGQGDNNPTIPCRYKTESPWPTQHNSLQFLWKASSGAV